MASVPITFRVSPELRVKLNQAAKAQGMDVGEFLRSLIQKHIETR